MIHYIIAAGIGAFLGSQSKKSKKSYAHGGEIKVGDTVYTAVYTDSDGEKHSVGVVANSESEAKAKAKSNPLDAEAFTYITKEGKIKDGRHLSEYMSIIDNKVLKGGSTYAHGGEIPSKIKKEFDKKIKNKKFAKAYLGVIEDEDDYEWSYKSGLKDYFEEWKDDNETFKIHNEIRQLKAKGLKNVYLNGFEEHIQYVVNKKYNDYEIKKHEEGSYSTTLEKGGQTYAEGGLLRVLKDSGFNHHKGSPKNELKHNRGAYIATIGKDNMGEVVHLHIYTPDTKRFISSTSFDNPKKLADYFNKNQLYAKGGKTANEILSFSFNLDNVSLKQIVEIVEIYTKDWRTSDNTSNVNMHVTLSKSKAHELELALKGEDVYDIERRESRYAKGGQTTPPITNYHKNIMGTLSFDLKVKGMRKPQDFIVYPIREKTDTISIQSDKKFGEINILTGRGILSKSGSAMYHLSLDKARSNVNEFQLSKGEVQELKTQIKSTTGKSVGGSFVKSDNSAADLLAKGGEVKFRKLAKSKNFDIVTPDGRFEIEVGAFGMPKSIIIDGHRRDINRNPLAIKYRTEIQEYLDKN